MTKLLFAFCASVFAVAGTSQTYEIRVSAGANVSNSRSLEKTLTYSESMHLGESWAFGATIDRLVESEAIASWSPGSDFSLSVGRNLGPQLTLSAEAFGSQRRIDVTQTINMDYVDQDGNTGNELWVDYAGWNVVEERTFSMDLRGIAGRCAYQWPSGLSVSLGVGIAKLMGDSVRYSRNYSVTYDDGVLDSGERTGVVALDWDAEDDGTAELNPRMLFIEPRVAYAFGGLEVFASMSRLNPGQGLYVPGYDQTWGYTRTGFDLNDWRSLSIGMAYRYVFLGI